jgi:hypothetical protein
VGFWKTYWGFSPLVRVCLAVLLVLGVCLLVLCLWGDSAHPPWFWPSWWHKLGYGLNIFASFTAFLIGVPIALVVLDTIKSDYAQQEQIDAVNRISSEAWSDFSKPVHDLCTDERIKALENADDHSSATDQVQTEHDLIIEKMEACRDALRKDRTSALAHVADLKSFLAAHATTLEQKRKAVDEQFGTKYKLRPTWNYILSRWQALDTHVRLRRMEFELEPMDQEWYKDILDKLSSSENALFDFLQVHGGTSSGREGIATMSNLQSIMDVSVNLPDQQLVVIFDNQYNEYIGSGVTGYWNEAFSASIFLRTLKIAVDQVTKSGWPENATKPKRETELAAAQRNENAATAKTASQPTGNDAPTDLPESSAE